MSQHPIPSLLRGVTYRLRDRHRGEIEVEGLLFAPDPKKFRSKEKVILNDPRYLSFVKKQQVLSERQKTAEREYYSIRTERDPVSMRELARVRRAIPACYKQLAEIEAKLAGECEVARLELTEKQRELDELPQEFPDYRVLSDWIAAEKIRVKKMRRNCQERIHVRKRRIEILKNELSRLEFLKQRMLEEKIDELEQIADAICSLAQNKRQFIFERVGNALEIPGQILTLVLKDPDIGAETESAIADLCVVPHDMTPGFWEIDSSDPRDGTLPLIALCIEDDLSQSMADLIVRVAMLRNCQFTDAMPALLRLRREGRLFYFSPCSDGTEQIVQWEPGVSKRRA